jgi:hypothetical protein
MAVDRLTGCSAIIVPRRIAHATRTQCLSMPSRSLVSALTFCSSLPWWELSPPNRQGEGRDLRTGLCFIAKRPLSGRLTRSVAALLTGSSRQRPNGFIGRRVGLDGPRFVIPRQTLVPSLPMVAIFPCRAVRDGELGPLRQREFA